MKHADPNRGRIFNKAVGLIADNILRQSGNHSKSSILDRFGNPLRHDRSAQYHFQRKAAQRKGSLKTWIPRQIDRSLASTERERIAERAIDLVQDDPMAAGVVETFASSVVGPGLLPHPTFDPEVLGITKEEAARIGRQQKAVWKRWAPFADAGQRMSINGLTYLAERSVVQFGEFIFTVPMVKRTDRPYMLSLKSVHPLRLKTPYDLTTRDDIRDGVEIGSNGEPKAYWIKKGSAGWLSETSKDFVRIPARAGHRYKVIHGFVTKDPEQVRGVSEFAASMKFFRDLNDYLDAELVSNIVTAAFSLFIEVGHGDPLSQAQAFSTMSETAYKSDQSEYTMRYEELTPGMIYYGQAGEIPHPISAQRPGATFEPFIKVIAKAIANSVGISYPVLFRDFEGMNYASYRSAMLEAWRVFYTRRKWLGQFFNQALWRMLMEEAYLKGEIGYRKFYSNFWEITSCDWIGPPKGQIEPVKEVQADVLAIRNHLKSREQVLLEQQRDFTSTIDQLAEENAMLEERGLNAVADESVENPSSGLENEEENAPAETSEE